MNEIPDVKSKIPLLRNLQQRIKLHDYPVFIALSTVIGISVGLAVVLFHHSMEYFNTLFFTRTKEGLFFLGAAAVIALPAIGMLIQSIMIKTMPDVAKKKGVAEIIKAVAIRGNDIPVKAILFHFLAPIICIGSGGTVGPEAPAAQLGGGVANRLSQLMKVTESRKRVLTAAGTGAAISAIFNTPLGGIFFALEVVLLNELQATTFSALVLASVAASSVSRIFIGNESVFSFSSPDAGGYQLYHVYAILGLVAGFVSIAFIRYSHKVENIFQQKLLTRLPRWAVMISVGIIVGVSGFYHEEIFGIGYVGINKILSNQLAWNVVLILFAMKFLLVPMILGSGGYGGIFAPSLFMGACFGFLCSLAANRFLGLNVDPTAFILISMGAILGGVNSIPISAILMIFEMTKDYSFILPLMLAVITSTMIVRLTLKKSINERHLEQQGYRIAKSKEPGVLQNILVKQVMLEEIELIPQETPLPKVLAKLTESPHAASYIIDSKGKITGTITEKELRPIMTEYEHLREMLVAKDIASQEVTCVTDSDNLENVMRLFELRDAETFPVVSAGDTEKIIGTIRRGNVIAAYNNELLHSEDTERFAHELRSVTESRHKKVFDNYYVSIGKAPAVFVGKSLSSIKLRNNYNVELLIIKKHLVNLESKDEEMIMPSSDYIIEDGDELILFGLEENLNKMRDI